jgi:GDP-L-fucose synthase
VSINPDARVFVAGHRGLVGSAVVRRLEAGGYRNLITATRGTLDLTRQNDVEQFFANEHPDLVVLAAAKVGGIHANNTQRASFILENLQIQTNTIAAAVKAGVPRLLFLGSSCIYPRACPQPMQENHLLTGPLEPTNEPYAIAKIAGIKLCEAIRRQHGLTYTSVMPTNLYGPNDNFDLQTSHVLPALIRKCHEAKVQGKEALEIWGSGRPRREFLHVDDMADACVFLLEHEDPIDLVNVGTGKDIPILELAQLIADVVGFDGEIVNDPSKPDGTPRKLLDVTRMAELGWTARIGLRDGIASTYDWYRNQLT